MSRMVESVERAARILLWLADNPATDGHAGQPLKLLSIGTGIDKATAHRIAASLEKHNLIKHDLTTHRYALGSAALRIGRAALDRHGLVSRCLPTMNLLAEQTNETISLAERQGRHSVTIWEIESNQLVRYANSIGRTAPLHIAAGSRAILAFSDPTTINAILNNPMSPMTEQSLTDPKILETEILKTRQKLYTHSYGERTYNVHSLSIPVLDASGIALGAISVLWPSRGNEIDRQRLSEWPALLVKLFYEINDHPRLES